MPAYRQLSSDERDRIAVLHAAGHALGLIATAVSRSNAKISRELRRNTCASGHYSPRHADGTYLGRRQRPAVLKYDQRLCTFVTDQLAEGWRPNRSLAGLARVRKRAWLASAARRSTASSTAPARRLPSSGAVCPAVTAAASQSKQGLRAIRSRTGGQTMNIPLLWQTARKPANGKAI
jgi:hypothetical protein